MVFALPIDYFGQNACALSKKRLFLFDMDGTIYEEETVFDGTFQLLDYINEIGGKYIFITNNSSKSVVDYVQKLNRLGIKADKENFFTSSQASVIFLQKNHPGARVYCQGTASLVKELKDCEIDVTEDVESVDVVLIGFDTEMTSEKLKKTSEILQTQNVVFIATNPDLRCPVNFGFIPDCGSICTMLELTTGKKPFYIGKPDPMMVDIVRERLGYSTEETVVIGDRLYTDIAAGLNAGVTAICVLTGEATVHDIHIGEIRPTYTFSSVKEMWKALISIYPVPSI